MELFLGQLAALSAAMLWATSAVLYRRAGTSVPPLLLNLYKGVFAMPMFLLLLSIRGELSLPGDGTNQILLLISGLVGIGVGDTAFFAALNRLGERRTVLIAETLAPPITAMLAWVWLSERLSPVACFGIAVTVTGVAWVVAQRSASVGVKAIESDATRASILLALLSALCQGVGAAMTRAALSESEIGPIWGSLLRLLGGFLILVVWIPLRGQSFFPASVRRGRIWAAILLATTIGTFMGIGCQQYSLQHTPAGITQTLIATSALFVLPYAAIQGHHIGMRAIAGASLAVLGIAMLVLAA